MTRLDAGDSFLHQALRDPDRISSRNNVDQYIAQLGVMTTNLEGESALMACAANQATLHPYVTERIFRYFVNHSLQEHVINLQTSRALCDYNDNQFRIEYDNPGNRPEFSTAARLLKEYIKDTLLPKLDSRATHQNFPNRIILIARLAHVLVSCTGLGNIDTFLYEVNNATNRNPGSKFLPELKQALITVGCSFEGLNEASPEAFPVLGDTDMHAHARTFLRGNKPTGGRQVEEWETATLNSANLLVINAKGQMPLDILMQDDVLLKQLIDTARIGNLLCTQFIRCIDQMLQRGTRLSALGQLDEYKTYLLRALKGYLQAENQRLGNFIDPNVKRDIKAIVTIFHAFCLASSQRRDECLLATIDELYTANTAEKKADKKITNSVILFGEPADRNSLIGRTKTKNSARRERRDRTLSACLEGRGEEGAWVGNSQPSLPDTPTRRRNDSLSSLVAPGLQGSGRPPSSPDTPPPGASTIVLTAPGGEEEAELPRVGPSSQAGMHGRRGAERDAAFVSLVEHGAARPPQ